MRASPSLLLAAAVILLMSVAAVGTPADADLWGHVAFGRDIVTTGAILQPDRYSFTTDRPWVNHEWLSELAFFGAYRWGGSAGLILLKTATIASLCGLLWWRLRRGGVQSGVGLALIGVAFAGTYWRMHTVRPQLFSVLFFAILLIVMTEADAGRRRSLLVVPPLLALWVNLHGGWIVGLGVFSFWMAVRILGWGSHVSRPRLIRERIGLAIVGLAAFSATLVNPYGVQIWTFLAETVRFGRPDIQDWGSILTSPLQLGVPWALTVAVAVIALTRSGVPSRRDIGVFFILAGLAVASFRVSRIDAFFALAVVILLAPRFAGAGAAESRRAAPRGSRLGMIAVTGFALAAMIVPAAPIIAAHAGCVTIGGPWVPDADAGRFIAQNRLKGRMLTWFDWGEYAIWHFGPDLRVSMDGRRETVYTDATIQAHWRFYAADETSLAYLRTLDPDFIWLPARLPVISRIADAGWTPIFTGPISVVFARAGAGPFQPVEGPSTTAMRCFPGP